MLRYFSLVLLNLTILVAAILQGKLEWIIIFIFLKNFFEENVQKHLNIIPSLLWHP